MTYADTINDLRRELDRALGALLETGEYLTSQAKADAILNGRGDSPLYPPLHTKITLAISHIHSALERNTPPPPGGNLRTAPIRADREGDDADTQ